jgi:hypothetical protein
MGKIGEDSRGWLEGIYIGDGNNRGRLPWGRINEDM